MLFLFPPQFSSLEKVKIIERSQFDVENIEKCIERNDLVIVALIISIHCNIATIFYWIPMESMLFYVEFHVDLILEILFSSFLIWIKPIWWSNFNNWNKNEKLKICFIFYYWNEKLFSLILRISFSFFLQLKQIHSEEIMFQQCSLLNW